MFSLKHRRILSVLLACALLFALCPQAFADTAYIKSNTTAYRTPSTGKGTVGKLKTGTEVEILAVQGSWTQVRKGSATGYVKTSKLVRVEPMNDLTAYTRAAAVMYKGYSTSSKKLGTLPAGRAVTVESRIGSMALVRYGSYRGYMKVSKLTTTAPEVWEDAGNRTAYAASDSAKLYNASGKAVSTLPVNTVVTVTAVKGSICKVQVNGSTYYMYRSDLSSDRVAVQADPTPTPTPAATSPDTLSTAAYVCSDGASVYNANGKAVGTLPLNTAVTVTAINGNVCRISYNGSTLYMKRTDLSGEQTEVNVTVYVCNDGAKVYNAQGKVIATLALNTALTATAAQGELLRVTDGRTVAFMYRQDLSSTKTQAPGGDVVEIPETTGYVCHEGAPVVDASGAQLATLPLNTAVTVRAYNDELCQVVSGSTVGYMKKSDISTSRTEPAAVTLREGDSGEAVKRVQARLLELGFFSGTVGGNFGTLTLSAVQQFQSAAKLSVTGVVDEETLTAMFSENAPKKSALTTTEITGSAATAAHGTAIEMDWWTSDIQKIFSRGTVATITDVATGLAWREKRYGGSNHADCEPLTAEDTATLKKVYGGTWSWNRRAVFVTINGVNYAASINGMPHGGSSISGNNFSGHHCIHFTNSRTHGSDKVCSLHQAAIKKALAATL